ncbi:MAG: STAS domain-containing protein [Gammaproteobacteria bacterium]
MALQVNISEDGLTMRIEMPERFAFDVHSELRKAYADNTSVENFIVDLSQTTYLDSSALGMLLQLREHAGDRYDSVRIINAKANVKEILNVANFGQMVTIN